MRMRFISCPLVIFFASVLLMQESALAQEIGRLFFTPTERVELDRLRKHMKTGKAIPETMKEVPAPEQISLDGFVRSSSGKNTTWMNQQIQSMPKHSQNITVDQQLSQAPSVSITLPSGKRMKLKVGQTVDVKTGKMRDVYEPMQRK